MATVKDILSDKSTHVWSISKEATVLEAASLMNEHRIGSLLIMTTDRIEGIFTERDVLRRVVGKGRDPATTSVAEVMTTDLTCCQPDTPLEEARVAMRNRRIRHLPVVDDTGKVHGMISIGDLNAHDLDAQELTIHFMREYLYGTT